MQRFSRVSASVVLIGCLVACGWEFDDAHAHSWMHAEGDSPNLHGRSAPLGDGLVGDGRTDNTDAFRRLLGAGNRTIHVARGDYLTGKITIPRGTRVVLDPGVIIRDSGKLGPNDRLINILEGDVQIRGAGARVVSRQSQYATGEQRHGIFIYGASNVSIEGLESSGHSGDGFYIGGPPKHPAQDITLERCRASGNKRQGLSIASARRVRIIDDEFDHTAGTPPQYGIDIEPNAEADVLQDIQIIRPKTDSNKGGGILLQLGMLDKKSEPISITIIDHTSHGETLPETKIRDKGVPGTVKYNRIS